MAGVLLCWKSWVLGHQLWIFQKGKKQRKFYLILQGLCEGWQKAQIGLTDASSALNYCISGIYELGALQTLTLTSSAAVINNKSFSLVNCSLSSCCLWFSLMKILSVFSSWVLLLSQVRLVALAECICEVAMALKRNICSLSASEVSVAQFKTAVISGIENINLLSWKVCLFCNCQQRQYLLFSVRRKRFE